MVTLALNIVCRHLMRIKIFFQETFNGYGTRVSRSHSEPRILLSLLSNGGSITVSLMLAVKSSE